MFDDEVLRRCYPLDEPGPGGTEYQRRVALLARDFLHKRIRAANDYYRQYGRQTTAILVAVEVATERLHRAIVDYNQKIIEVAGPLARRGRRGR